jgi:hypothetical protein
MAGEVLDRYKGSSKMGTRTTVCVLEPTKGALTMLGGSARKPGSDPLDRGCYIDLFASSLG